MFRWLKEWFGLVDVLGVHLNDASGHHRVRDVGAESFGWDGEGLTWEGRQITLNRCDPLFYSSEKHVLVDAEAGIYGTVPWEFRVRFKNICVTRERDVNFAFYGECSGWWTGARLFRPAKTVVEAIRAGKRERRPEWDGWGRPIKRG